jgi:hypothetical protein
MQWYDGELRSLAVVKFAHKGVLVDFEGPVDTGLPDLEEVGLGGLRSVPAAELSDCQQQIRSASRQSRKNLGSSGPPGRVD